MSSALFIFLSDEFDSKICAWRKSPSSILESVFSKKLSRQASESLYFFELKYSCAAFKSSSAEESDELFFSNEVEEISCEDATSLPEEISLKVCVEGFSFS